MFRYSNLLFMKQQLSFYSFLMFQQYTSIGSKIIEILVVSVIKNDFQQFLKELMIVFIFATFCGCRMSLSKVMVGWCNFALPHLKKAPIIYVLLQTFVLIVQFSKTYLKTLSWTFFMNGRIYGFYVISFKCSINQLSNIPSTSSSSIAI